jgi:hypothetical protein
MKFKVFWTPALAILLLPFGVVAAEWAYAATSQQIEHLRAVLRGEETSEAGFQWERGSCPTGEMVQQSA